MANTGYSNSNYLDLGYEVNIHGGSGVLADDRTRAVKLSDLYNDIKNYVAANIDLQLQVVNVPTTQTKPRLSLLGDKRTFALDVPNEAITVDDVAVNITSDQIKDPDPAGLGITNQKGYNEYSLERIKWLVAWEARADKNAVYSDPDHDPIDHPAAVLDNWMVTAQLPHPDIGKKEQAINKLDGYYLIDMIDKVDLRVSNTQSFVYALYQANQFNRYCIKVEDGTGIKPNPGELVYQQAKYKDQTFILINELSYPNDYLEVDDTDSIDPDIPNAYGVFNNKSDVVINIDGKIFHVNFNDANPNDPIERIEDGDNVYYRFNVTGGNAEDADAVDSGTDTQPVGVYKTSAEVNALLQDYMKKDGKLADGTDDHFKGEIDFRAGLHLSEGDSYIKLNGETGVTGEVLTSQGDETPVWTDIEKIYVKKAGDTMTGTLVMEHTQSESDVLNIKPPAGGTNIIRVSSISGEITKTQLRLMGYTYKNSFAICGGSDGAEPIVTCLADKTLKVHQNTHYYNSNLEFHKEWPNADISNPNKRFTRIKSNAVIDTDSNSANYNGGDFGIKVDLSAGNTGKNKLSVVAKNDKNIVTISAGNGPAIILGTGFDGNNSGAMNVGGGVRVENVATPTELSPPHSAVNKGYVDAAVLASSVIEGGCIELNGGNLCGGEPHPLYIDTFKNSNLVKLDERPNIDGGHVNNRVFEESNEIYRTAKKNNNTTKDIYKTNYKDGTHELIGKFYDSAFFSSDYTQRSDIKEGTVSFDKKYLICGEKWGGYGSASTDNLKRQYIFRKDISSPSSALNENQYNKRIQVVYGYSSYHFCTSMLSTGPRPDSRHGYMIGAFYHRGNQSGTRTYTNSLIIYNYELDAFHAELTELLFNSTFTPYVWEGNPEYDEYFVTCSSSSNTYVPAKKIKLTDVYNQIETEDLFTGLDDTIHSITYLHKSKRYYLGGYKKGYLTKPYDGPLDNNALNDAIIFELPEYTTPSFTGKTDTAKMYNSLNRAFEFGSEIVVEGLKSTTTIYENGNNSNSKQFKIPKAIGIYTGGSEFEIYYSEVDTDPDFDGFGEGTYYYYNQSIPHIHFQHKFQSPSQLYGNGSIATPNDAEFITPNITQPYSQPIYWNGIEMGMKSIPVERYPQTFGINSDVYVVDVYSQSDIRDGNVYKTANGSPSSGSFNGAFLTNGWIKKNVDPDMPLEATDVRINDLSGKWDNHDSTIYDNYDRRVTTRGTVETFNGVKGVSVIFDNDSYISGSKNHFTMEAPNAVTAMIEHNDTGLGPLE